MRILLVHNYYGSDAPSGESNVFNIEKKLLESEGHTVDVFTRDSDEIRNQGVIGLVKGALSTPWNPFSAGEIRKKVISFKPDVVHVHNTFPLISPAIFHSIGTLAAKVLTLHNYRLLCPAAIPMRNGQVCTDCIDQKSVLPSIKHSCYRESRIATIPLAANVALHRHKNTWNHNVDAFIVLSDFQKDLMSKGGLPAEKMYIKPNFYETNPDVIPFIDRRNYVVFVGRLSKEKGVLTLINAWKDWGRAAPELRIIGSGPLFDELNKIVKKESLNIKFYGQISSEAAQEQIAHASLMVLPSEWFEGFPMVVREAFALGTPVVASNLGPLPSIIRDDVNGLIFEAADSKSLKDVMVKAWGNSEKLHHLSSGARLSYEELYNKNVNYHTLIDIYKNAIANKEMQV